MSARDEVDRQFPFLRDWLRILAERGPIDSINWQMVAGWALTALAPAPAPAPESGGACPGCGGLGWDDRQGLPCNDGSRNIRACPRCGGTGRAEKGAGNG